MVYTKKHPALLIMGLVMLAVGYLIGGGYADGFVKYLGIARTVPEIKAFTLYFGVGSVVGALIGALIIRTISFYFRILSIDPLLQSLVEGIVLLAAVSLGAIRTLRVKNRLELFR